MTDSGLTSHPTDEVAARTARQARRWPLVMWMSIAIGVVTALAWWDARGESAAALDDLGTEQAVIAASLAGSLRAHLAARAGGDGVSAGEIPDLIDRARNVERAGELVVFLAPPREPSLYGMDGRALTSSRLRASLARGESTLRLTRAEAAELNLPPRTAMAGLSTVSAGDGAWGIVAAGTAARQRDCEARAFWRLVLGVVVASGLVLAFGGMALRTQRAQLELSRELAVAEARRERDGELLRASRVATMGTFAIGIAHEVATPLGVIVGRAEQLQPRLQGDERATHGVKLILKQADTIQQIVRRFLDLARGAPPALGLAEATDVAKAAAASVEHRFAKASVSLETDLPPLVPAVRCDRALLEHAIVNLLLNACEACSPGKHVRLHVRTESERVAFVVTDDGVGISTELAARVTEPFFTTKLESGGSGLGLAIATEIAKIHRGELTIAPNAPQGTRACILLPAAPVEREREARGG